MSLTKALIKKHLPLALTGGLFFALSCSHQRPAQEPSIVEEYHQENISIDAILNLARASYLKGCVDGKNLFSAGTKQSAFKACRDLSTKHGEEIKVILESERPSK